MTIDPTTHERDREWRVRSDTAARLGRVEACVRTCASMLASIAHTSIADAAIAMRAARIELDACLAALADHERGGEP